MKCRTASLTVAVCLLALPAKSFADWFIAAGIGVARGGSLHASDRTYTGQFGFTQHDGWIGIEGDFGYTVAIREGVSARSLSGSVLIGRPFDVGVRLRPYGSVGAGILGGIKKTSQIFNPFDSETANETVATYGAGAIVDLTKKFAARIDVRQFRTIKKIDINLLGQDVAFEFTRVSVGILWQF